jgi:hypothetical protein
MASTTTEVVVQVQQANGNRLRKMHHSEFGHKSMLKSGDQMTRGRNQTGEFEMQRKKIKRSQFSKPNSSLPAALLAEALLDAGDDDDDDGHLDVHEVHIVTAVVQLSAAQIQAAALHLPPRWGCSPRQSRHGADTSRRKLVNFHWVGRRKIRFF